MARGYGAGRTKGKTWKLKTRRKGVVPSEKTRDKMSESQKARRQRERDEKKKGKRT